MSWFSVICWLLPRRLRSSWLLLAVTGFGILAAVTLMAVGAVYARALAEGGLLHAVGSKPADVLNARIIAQNRPLGSADYQRLRETIEPINEEHLGFMIRETQRLGQARPNLSLIEIMEDKSPPLDSIIGRPFFFTGFEQHSRLVEGRWPESDPVLHEKGLDLEAVLGAKAARSMGWTIGKQVFLIPFKGDPSERIAITVVGLAEPLDRDDEYWMGYSFYFNVQASEENPLVPFYLPEDLFFSGLGARYPALVGDYTWFLYLNTGEITSETAGDTLDAVVSLETDVNKQFPRSMVFTGLKPTLKDYQRDLTLASIPLFLFISMLLVVILYFLVLIMGLLAHTRSDEASLLRSRGASMLQVASILASAEAIIIVVATVLGPVLGFLMVRYWLLGAIDPASNTGEPLALGLSSAVWVTGWDFLQSPFHMAALGGLLTLTVMVASALNLSRLGVVEFLRERARPPTVPFLHRYYVDFFVLALSGLLLWQIQGRGGFIQQSLSDRTLEVEPTMLIAPALAILSTAFLMLRSLPIIIKSLAWLSSYVAPAWIRFTLVRIARDPLPITSLTVMVSLAATLGIFGSAFQTTLSRSQQEQVLYKQGGELVLSRVTFPVLEQDARLRALTEIEHVESISPVHREIVTLMDGLPKTAAVLMAIDPVTLPNATWFREDFSESGKNLSELLVPLRVGQTGLPDLNGNSDSGIPIPSEAMKIGIWVKANETKRVAIQQVFNLWIRISDGNGRHRDVQLGTLPTSQVGAPAGWTFKEADMQLDASFFDPPFAVVSIYITGRSYSRMPPGGFSLDDLLVTAPGSPKGGQIIEDFEEPGRWVTLTHEGDKSDTISHPPSAAHSGDGGLNFSWINSISSTPRGIIIPPGPSPIPAIGGPQFHIGQEIRIRSKARFVPVVIRETTNFFPSLDPNAKPFLLVSHTGYGQYVKRMSGGLLDPTKEFWLDVTDGEDHRKTIRDLEEELPMFASIEDRNYAVSIALRNPLAGGGWNSLTILAIMALTIAVVLALGTHAAVAVKSGRVESTIGRALGFSRLQLFLSLALERVMVAAVGIGVGSAVGIGIAWWVLGFLNRSPSGREVMPSMILTTEPWIIASTLISLGIAAALATFLALILSSRLRASDILRTGG